MSSVAFWNARKRQKRTAHVVFQLKDPDTLVFRLKYIANNTPLKNIKKISRCEYEIRTDQLQEVVTICDKHGWEVIPFPDTVQKALEYDIHMPFDDSFKETHLWKCMFPYQKEGVEKIITSFNSKALLADSMGLGKSLQALALFNYISRERHIKLLIICPAYLRFTWANEIEKWCPGTTTSVILTGKDSLDKPSPLIVSYELAAKKAKELKRMKFGMVICDESHYMKSHKTKRTKAITPLVKSIPKALLLTGTPALNRPVEMFAQLHMLRPTFFPKYKQYTERYCDGKISPIGYYDASGMSNNHELTWLVRKTCMVRRLKRDVMSDLPDKIRSEIYLQLSRKSVRPMDPLFKRWKELNQTIPNMVPASDEIKKAGFERKCLISELFRMTSVAKVDVVKKVVQDMVDQGIKFIVFCYHKKLMDAIQEVCPSHIRIDGNTPQKKRQELVDDFQQGDAQVAILSLLAASTGLTLTACSTMLFGELYFVPGTILQAEARIHRISQKNNCDIRYIIAKGSLDEHIYKMLNFKLATLDTALDGRSDRTIKGKRVEWGGLDL